jgi:hypothetical protein
MCCVLRSPISQTYIYLKSLLVNTHDPARPARTSFLKTFDQSHLFHSKGSSTNECAACSVRPFKNPYISKRMIFDTTDFLSVCTSFSTPSVRTIYSPYLERSFHRRKCGALLARLSQHSYISKCIYIYIMDFLPCLNLPFTPFQTKIILKAKAIYSLFHISQKRFGTKKCAAGLARLSKTCIFQNFCV